MFNWYFRDLSLTSKFKSFLKKRDEYPEGVNYAKATEEQVDNVKTPEEGDVAKTPEQLLEAAKELPC